MLLYASGFALVISVELWQIRAVRMRPRQVPSSDYGDGRVMEYNKDGVGASEPRRAIGPNSHKPSRSAKSSASYAGCVVWCDEFIDSGLVIVFTGQVFSSIYQGNKRISTGDAVFTVGKHDSTVSPFLTVLPNTCIPATIQQ